MELIDITQAYEQGMQRYGSIDDFSYTWIRHYDNGFPMALSRFSMTSHLGTHIDSPFHFLKQGKKIRDIPLDRLCGPAQVIDARGMECVDKDFLLSFAITCPRLLFYTDNTYRLKSGGEFDNIYFTKDACAYLVEKQVVLVGTDYFSVDRRGDKNRTAHMALLQNEVIILEAVVLEHVPEGEYTLYCLPLKLKELEGAPCRAVLQKLQYSHLT